MRQRRFRYGSFDPHLKRLFLRKAMSHAWTTIKKARCELAHIRDFLWSDTYGECRDNRKLRSSAAICRHGSKQITCADRMSGGRRELALRRNAAGAGRELKELSHHGGVYYVFFIHLLQKEKVMGLMVNSLIC